MDLRCYYVHMVALKGDYAFVCGVRKKMREKIECQKIKLTGIHHPKGKALVRFSLAA